MTIDTARLATDAGYWDECGAPEDAEEFGTSNRFFYKRENGVWFFCSKVPQMNWAKCSMGQPLDENRIPRPQSEWKGGLPPAGTKCKLNLYGYWIVATILAYGKTKFLYEISPGQVDTDGDPIGGELEGFIKKAQFRPIPTKAQRDRDELNKIINAAMRSGDGDAAAAIISAGWTKP